MQKMKLLLQRPAYRYAVVGGAVYLFELLMIVSVERLGASAPLAVAISFVSGTALSFVLQKVVTFGDKRTHRHILIPQIVATALLIIWNLAFSVMLTKLLQDIWPAVVIRTVALLITTAWNFYLYKTRIFKTPEVESTQ